MYLGVIILLKDSIRMLTDFTPKNSQKLECIICLFKCIKQSDLNRHILTRKHEKNVSLTNTGISLTKITPITPTHICSKCNKEYNSRVGLWYHEKKCQYSIEEQSTNIIVVQDKSDSDIKALTNLVFEVVKNNQDLQKQMVELCKNVQSNITMNNNCNNNNTFNMQVFLNEECKDAMNMSDFVNSFDIQIEDLESVGVLGYTTGLSNIIVKELKLLDIYKRPIHCSDLKREVFYIKDNDIWEKETPENSNMKKAIKGITKKNMIKLNDWRDIHPDCEDIDSTYNDIYMKLIIESCGGRGDLSNSENKILKNIAKEVVIKKII